MLTPTIRLGAAVVFLVIAFSGCSTQSSPARVADDCTVEDYTTAGTPVRPDCAYSGIDLTLLGTSGEVLVRFEQHYHAEPFFAAVGLVPDTFESAEDVVAHYALEAEAQNSVSGIQERLQLPLTNADGSSPGVVGDYVSEDDLSLTYELHGHQLALTSGYIDSVYTLDFVVTDAGLTFDMVEEMYSAGHLSITFPGPVGDTNGIVTGNQVRWEWDSAGEESFYAEYATTAFALGQGEETVGDIYDFDARYDVSLLAVEISIWYIENLEPPVLEQRDGEYYFGAEGALEFIGHVSSGVTIDHDATYLDSPTNWCITVVHPLGTHASTGVSYSATEALQDDPCPTP